MTGARDDDCHVMALWQWLVSSQEPQASSAFSFPWPSDGRCIAQGSLGSWFKVNVIVEHEIAYILQFSFITMAGIKSIPESSSTLEFYAALLGSFPVLACAHSPRPHCGIPDPALPQTLELESLLLVPISLLEVRIERTSTNTFDSHVFPAIRVLSPPPTLKRRHEIPTALVRFKAKEDKEPPSRNLQLQLTSGIGCIWRCDRDNLGKVTFG